MQENKPKVLVGLSERLVLAIDKVADDRQISRTAFIRESIIQNLLYNKRNRDLMSFYRDHALSTPSLQLTIGDWWVRQNRVVASYRG